MSNLGRVIIQRRRRGTAIVVQVQGPVRAEYDVTDTSLNAVALKEIADEDEANDDGEDGEGEDGQAEDGEAEDGADERGRRKEKPRLTIPIEDGATVLTALPSGGWVLGIAHLAGEDRLNVVRAAPAR